MGEAGRRLNCDKSLWVFQAIIRNLKAMGWFFKLSKRNDITGFVFEKLTLELSGASFSPSVKVGVVKDY